MIHEFSQTNFLGFEDNKNLRVKEMVVGLSRAGVLLAVCCALGGGPKSVGDILKLRTSRFLAAPAKKSSEKTLIRKILFQ